MAHGLELRMKDFVEHRIKESFLEVQNPLHSSDLNPLLDGESIIQSWMRATKYPKNSKMEYYDLLRQTLKYMFSTKWPDLQVDLLQAYKNYYDKFSTITRNCSQVYHVVFKIANRPWQNYFFNWKDMFSGDLTVDRKEVKDYFAFEPEDIVLGRVHSLVLQKQWKAAMILAKLSFLYHCRITKQLGFPLQKRSSLEEPSYQGLSSIDWFAYLLQKTDSLPIIMGEIKQLKCHEGIEIIRRILLDSSKTKFCLTLVHGLLLYDMITDSNNCCTKELFELFFFLNKDLNSDLKEVVESARKLLAPHAPSSAYLYLFIDVLWKHHQTKCLEFHVELYIRAFTADLNHLENKKCTDPSEVSYIETHLANMFAKLSTLFCGTLNLAARECLFSAFSLRPTKKRLHKLQSLTRALSASDEEDRTASISTYVGTCNCRLKCSGPCRTKINGCVINPLLNMGIKSVSYRLIKDLVSVLESVRDIQFQYNTFSWQNNAAELEDYLTKFNQDKISARATCSDTEVESDGDRSEPDDSKCVPVNQSIRSSANESHELKRKGNSFDISTVSTFDVAANVEVVSASVKRFKAHDFGSEVKRLHSSGTANETSNQATFVENKNKSFPSKQMFSTKYSKETCNDAGALKFLDVNKQSQHRIIVQQSSVTEHENLHSHHLSNKTSMKIYRSGFECQNNMTHYDNEKSTTSSSVIKQSSIIYPSKNLEVAQRSLSYTNQSSVVSPVSQQVKVNNPHKLHNIENAEEVVLNLSCDSNFQREKYLYKSYPPASQTASLQQHERTSVPNSPIEHMKSSNLQNNAVISYKSKLASHDRNSVIHHTMQHVRAKPIPISKEVLFSLDSNESLNCRKYDISELPINVEHSLPKAPNKVALDNFKVSHGNRYSNALPVIPPSLIKDKITIPDYILPSQRNEQNVQFANSLNTTVTTTVKKVSHKPNMLTLPISSKPWVKPQKNICPASRDDSLPIPKSQPSILQPMVSKCTKVNDSLVHPCNRNKIWQDNFISTSVSQQRNTTYMATSINQPMTDHAVEFNNHQAFTKQNLASTSKAFVPHQKSNLLSMTTSSSLPWYSKPCPDSLTYNQESNSVLNNASRSVAATYNTVTPYSVTNSITYSKADCQYSTSKSSLLKSRLVGSKVFSSVYNSSNTIKSNSTPTESCVFSPKQFSSLDHAQVSSSSSGTSTSVVINNSNADLFSRGDKLNQSNNAYKPVLQNRSIFAGNSRSSVFQAADNTQHLQQSHSPLISDSFSKACCSTLETDPCQSCSSAGNGLKEENDTSIQESSFSKEGNSYQVFDGNAFEPVASTAKYCSAPTKNPEDTFVRCHLCDLSLPVYLIDIHLQESHQESSSSAIQNKEQAYPVKNASLENSRKLITDEEQLTNKQRSFENSDQKYSKHNAQTNKKEINEQASRLYLKKTLVCNSNNQKSSIVAKDVFNHEKSISHLNEKKNDTKVLNSTKLEELGIFYSEEPSPCANQLIRDERFIKRPSQANSLKNNMNQTTKHLEEKICSKCNKQFPSDTALRKHFETYHRIEKESNIHSAANPNIVRIVQSSKKFNNGVKLENSLLHSDSFSTHPSQIFEFDSCATDTFNTEALRPTQNENLAIETNCIKGNRLDQAGANDQLNKESVVLQTDGQLVNIKKQSNTKPCMYCNKILTVQYMRQHIAKMHGGMQNIQDTNLNRDIGSENKDKKLVFKPVSMLLQEDIDTRTCLSPSDALKTKGVEYDIEVKKHMIHSDSNFELETNKSLCGKMNSLSRSDSNSQIDTDALPSTVKKSKEHENVSLDTDELFHQSQLTEDNINGTKTNSPSQVIEIENTSYSSSNDILKAVFDEKQTVSDKKVKKTKPKNFKCEICPKCFSYNKNLLKHVEKYHCVNSSKNINEDEMQNDKFTFQSRNIQVNERKISDNSKQPDNDSKSQYLENSEKTTHPSKMLFNFDESNKNNSSYSPSDKASLSESGSLFNSNEYSSKGLSGSSRNFEKEDLKSYSETTPFETFNVSPSVTNREFISACSSYNEDPSFDFNYQSKNNAAHIQPNDVSSNVMPMSKLFTEMLKESMDINDPYQINNPAASNSPTMMQTIPPVYIQKSSITLQTSPSSVENNECPVRFNKMSTQKQLKHHIVKLHPTPADRVDVHQIKSMESVNPNIFSEFQCVNPNVGSSESPKKTLLEATDNFTFISGNEGIQEYTSLSSTNKISPTDDKRNIKHGPFFPELCNSNNYTNNLPYNSNMEFLQENNSLTNFKALHSSATFQKNSFAVEQLKVSNGQDKNTTLDIASFSHFNLQDNEKPLGKCDILNIDPIIMSGDSDHALMLSELLDEFETHTNPSIAQDDEHRQLPLQKEAEIHKDCQTADQNSSSVNHCLSSQTKNLTTQNILNNYLEKFDSEFNNDVHCNSEVNFALSRTDQSSVNLNNIFSDKFLDEKQGTPTFQCEKQGTSTFQCEKQGTSTFQCEKQGILDSSYSNLKSVLEQEIQECAEYDTSIISQGLQTGEHETTVNKLSSASRNFGDNEQYITVSDKMEQFLESQEMEQFLESREVEQFSLLLHSGNEITSQNLMSSSEVVSRETENLLSLTYLTSNKTDFTSSVVNREKTSAEFSPIKSKPISSENFAKRKKSPQQERECSICFKKLSNSWALKRHMLKMHPSDSTASSTTKCKESLLTSCIGNLNQSEGNLMQNSKEDVLHFGDQHNEISSSSDKYENCSDIFNAVSKSENMTDKIGAPCRKKVLRLKHKCSVCFKELSSTRSLKRHVLKIHPDAANIPPESCTIFSNAYAVNETKRKIVSHRNPSNLSEHSKFGSSSSSLKSELTGKTAVKSSTITQLPTITSADAIKRTGNIFLNDIDKTTKKVETVLHDTHSSHANLKMDTISVSSISPFQLADGPSVQNEGEMKSLDLQSISPNCPINSTDLLATDIQHTNILEKKQKIFSSKEISESASNKSELEDVSVFPPSNLNSAKSNIQMQGDSLNQSCLTNSQILEVAPGDCLNCPKKVEVAKSSSIDLSFLPQKSSTGENRISNISGPQSLENEATNLTVTESNNKTKQQSPLLIKLEAISTPLGTISDTKKKKCLPSEDSFQSKLKALEGAFNSIDTKNSKKCRYCHKIFDSIATLTNHLRKVHSIPVIKKSSSLFSFNSSKEDRETSDLSSDCSNSLLTSNKNVANKNSIKKEHNMPDDTSIETKLKRNIYSAPKKFPDLKTERVNYTENLKTISTKDTDIEAIEQKPTKLSNNSAKDASELGKSFSDSKTFEKESTIKSDTFVKRRSQRISCEIIDEVIVSKPVVHKRRHDSDEIICLSDTSENFTKRCNNKYSFNKKYVSSFVINKRRQANKRNKKTFGKIPSFQRSNVPKYTVKMCEDETKLKLIQISRSSNSNASSRSLQNSSKFLNCKRKKNHNKSKISIKLVKSSSNKKKVKQRSNLMHSFNTCRSSSINATSKNKKTKISTTQSLQKFSHNRVISKNNSKLRRGFYPIQTLKAEDIKQFLSQNKQPSVCLQRYVSITNKPDKLSCLTSKVNSNVVPIVSLERINPAIYNFSTEFQHRSKLKSTYQENNLHSQSNLDAPVPNYPIDSSKFSKIINFVDDGKKALKSSHPCIVRSAEIKRHNSCSSIAIGGECAKSTIPLTKSCSVVLKRLSANDFS